VSKESLFVYVTVAYVIPLVLLVALNPFHKALGVSQSFEFWNLM